MMVVLVVIVVVVVVVVVVIIIILRVVVVGVQRHRRGCENRSGAGVGFDRARECRNATTNTVISLVLANEMDD